MQIAFIKRKGSFYLIYVNCNGQILCFFIYLLSHASKVVCSFMKTTKHDNGRPKNWRFKCVRVLVVDEGSLVCVQLLNTVLSLLCRHARLCKFILLGRAVTI